MIKAQKDGPGLNAGGRPQKTGSLVELVIDRGSPTLAEAGIDKKLSSRSQAIASIPEDEFEETLVEHREAQQAEQARIQAEGWTKWTKWTDV